MSDMDKVREIVERYLLPADISGTWPWLGIGGAHPAPESVGVEGFVNVLAGDAPLSGTVATLRAWMLTRAEALIGELDAAGWHLATGAGPSIEFRSKVGTGVYPMNMLMVKRGTEDMVECKVELHLVWAEMAPEKYQISEEDYRAAMPYSRSRRRTI